MLFTSAAYKIKTLAFSRKARWFAPPMTEVKSRCIPASITFRNFVELLGMHMWFSEISDKALGIFIP